MKSAFGRREMVTLLANLGPQSEAAVPELIELLTEGTPDAIRVAAALALGKIGKGARTAVDNLIEALCHGGTALAAQAVCALADIGCADQRVRAALGAIWLAPADSKNLHLRVAYALCKLKIAAPHLLRFLTKVLVTDQDSGQRELAILALGCCDRNELDVVPALWTAAVSDKSEEIRQQAAACLEQLHVSPVKAIRVCAKQLGESPYAETALHNSGPLALPGLIDVLRSGNAEVRPAVLRVLGKLGEAAAPAAPEVAKALRDPHVETRLAAAKCLWNITKKPDLVVPVLVDMLEQRWLGDQDTVEARRRFYQTVMEALQRIGPPAMEAVPALTDKTKDKNRLVSESAQRALREIAPK
jgi:HEAT repeat protein